MDRSIDWLVDELIDRRMLLITFSPGGPGGPGGPYEVNKTMIKHRKFTRKIKGRIQTKSKPTTAKTKQLQRKKKQLTTATNR